MATRALDASSVSKVIGPACVDLTAFQPTALMPADSDVLLIKTPDCMASANDKTPKATVFKTPEKVNIPQRWRGGPISAVAVPRA